MANLHSISLNNEQSELVKQDKNLSLSKICQDRLNEIIEFRNSHEISLENLQRKIKALENRIKELDPND